MGARLKGLLVYILFAFNLLLTVSGLYFLYASPYTGIRASVQENRTVVRGVVKGSPAETVGIKKGDVLLDVENMGLPYFSFSSDPDYVSARRDYRLLWESLGRLDKKVKVGKPIEVSIRRDNEFLKFAVEPKHFPLFEALKRTLSVYLVAWTFMVIGFLVLRKKTNEISVANFIIGTGVCTSLVSFAPYTVRDLTYPYLAFRILKETNYLGSMLAPFGFLHLILVFPRRRQFVDKYPWLIKAVYALLCIVIFINYIEIFENTHLTVYLPISLCLFIFLVWVAYDFFKEKDHVLRRQIQWLVFGFAVGIFAWLTFTSIPVLFGSPLLSEELSMLPAVVIPVSFAFAITRYRLMDIDTLFDYTVIYGATILILEGIELTFLGFVSPYLSASVGVPFISIATVLLIVFVYVPIRNTVKKGVEKLFKRGTYDMDNEIQRFNVRLSLCDDTSSLDKFSSFVKGLLGHSGCCVLRRAEEVVYADSEKAKLVGLEIAKTKGLGDYFINRGQLCFGYEIADAGLQVSKALHSALFVPIFTVAELYLVVFLEKWNRTAYSNKDRTLLNTLATNIGHVLEAERLRREKSAIEEEFNRQKDYVVKEMHDGLGNILTNITVASQVAKGAFGADKEKAQAMVAMIAEHSQEAMEFMRAGLSVLDNPQGTMGIVISGIRHRYSKLLESAGVEAHFSVESGLESARLGAKANLNLVRSLQEAVSNILKHSGAKKVEISFFREGLNLRTIIRDEGKGFDTTSVKKGLGLDNMRKRMLDIGGSFSVKSELGRGTEISLSIPLKSPSKGIEESKALT